MKKRLINLMMIVAGVLLVLLVFQNLGPAEIRLLFWKATLSKAALICLTGFLGMLCGPLFLHWFKGRWGDEAQGGSAKVVAPKKAPPPPAMPDAGAES